MQCRGRGQLGAGEAGSAAVETALVTPLVVVVVLGLIQFGLWYHAQQLVIAAAQEASAQASVEGADRAAAQERARVVLRALSGLATPGDVAVEPVGADAVGVTVHATLDAILPGMDDFELKARSVSRLEAVR